MKQLLKKIFDYNTEGSFVNNLRKKRFNSIKTHFERLISEKGTLKILDIGGELHYWEQLDFDISKCHITLLNLTAALIPADKTNFVSVAGNAMDLPYKKGDFDMIYSNSVIEHMGSKKGQEQFAEQVFKVADKFILQTPSFWFPLEPHSRIPFFQFIPHFLRAYLIMGFNINYFPKQKKYKDAYNTSKSTILFTKARLQQLFPGCECVTETLFGLPKSYLIIKM